MRVRYGTWPANKSNDGSDLRIGDETAVCQLHSGRHTYIATIVRLSTAGADTAFESIARRSPGNFHAVVIHDIEIRIGRGNQCGPAVASGSGNHTPVFNGGILQVVVGVKEPVIGVGDQSFEFGIQVPV